MVLLPSEKTYNMEFIKPKHVTTTIGAKTYYDFYSKNEVAKLNETFDRNEEFRRIEAMVKERYNDVAFFEDEHKYIRDGVELTPVTSLIHTFQEEVDWDRITKNYAFRNHVNEWDVKKWWKIKNRISTYSGTRTHEFAEMCFYFYTNQMHLILPEYRKIIEKEGLLIPRDKKELAAARFWAEFVQVPGLIPLLSETRVHSCFLPGIKPYCGTFDLLMYYKDPNSDLSGVIIMDYKTNESLTSDYNREHGKNLLPPFNDLVEEDLSIYTLQLSAYQIPLQYDLGLRVLGRRIVYLKEDGNYEIFKVDDRSEQLKQALTV